MADAISRQAAITQLSHNKNKGDDEWELAVANDIQTIWKLPSVQPEPHWIPVTERLPEYGKAVLTVNKDGDYEINHIIDDEEGDFFYYGAIAWMPLPEPYKGVTE